jgi:membrane protein
MTDTGTSRGPDSPADLDKRSWFYVARKTAREFSKDECTDIAAALTYYAVLALFPALIALLSVVGLVGQTEETVDTLLGILDDVGASSVADTLRPTIEQLAGSQSAGFALIIGLATALWSASGYVSAFGRALNRMYETPEGRPFWKFRPIMIVVTAVVLVLAAIVALALVLTGPAAQAVGDAIGVGSTAVTLWNWLKWPVMLFVVVVIVALLYWATPNVKQPKFRWLSVGAVFAILVWILASLAFGFYVANFSSYNRTYGALAGVIVFLLWLWITNIALLFGAELDSELERGRELEAGLPAERSLQLPPRDTTKIEKDEKKQAKDIEKGREIREQHARAAAQDTSNGDGKAP